MAIIRKEDEVTETSLPLVVNNGDLVALRAAVDRLGFRNEESLLRFALAVISKAATRTLTVTDQEGKTVSLNPGDSLVVAPPVKEPA